MKNQKLFELIRTYWIAALITIIIWGWVALVGGSNAFITVAILTVLELTFSFDNAVINSKILATLSPLWQTLFLTIGIVIAVFVVRFCVPILIVSLSANLGFAQVITMALNEPMRYSHALAQAAPIIEAFGGTFLLLVGISYFVDASKTVHWWQPIERRLARIGRMSSATVLAMIVLAAVTYFTVEHQREAVLIASVAAIGLQLGLSLLDQLMSRRFNTSRRHKVGLAAFSAFLYLQVIDASFSLDGVIGAFAITTSALLIMAGLGAGAVWVRAMTVHLVRTGALARYRYLAHGAHWAIITLGAIMILKLHGFELADWVTGAIGLTLIVLSMIGGKKARSL